MVRCDWAKKEVNVAYHDEEWGVPVHDERTWFEFLILEGAQAGLSWDTILRKRARYREVFGISVCGVDDLLCVDAGDGDGERSSGELFSV